MRAAIPALVGGTGGSIINVSSTGGLDGTPFLGAYCASKFAVTGMTKVAALELAGAGVRVNSIHPGPIRTPLLDMPGLDVAAAVAAAVPMARIGEPEEVARLALFLASDESSFCTGSSFVADGGQTAGTGAEAFKDM
jgi:3alpha(or 20beta)-hydroxysteroid dehydrogenase